MKIKLTLFGLAVLVAGVWFISSILQLQETTISARYEMFACEDCNHMTVEKSKDQSLVGKTIIPVSSVIDVEQMIESIALTKEPLCLRGKAYRYNWNLLNINPDGVRFEVTAKEDYQVCGGLWSSNTQDWLGAERAANDEWRSKDIWELIS